jgi:hypothetical protein
MKVIFFDLTTKRNKEYQTSAKELTVEGIARILVANTPLIPTAAKVVVERGRWPDKNTWVSPSNQYCVELVTE